jgi:hypothetical protein
MQSPLKDCDSTRGRWPAVDQGMSSAPAHQYAKTPRRQDAKTPRRQDAKTPRRQDAKTPVSRKSSVKFRKINDGGTRVSIRLLARGLIRPQRRLEPIYFLLSNTTERRANPTDVAVALNAAADTTHAITTKEPAKTAGLRTDQGQCNHQSTPRQTPS